MTKLLNKSVLSKFIKDENGLALTEYLILLGLLTAVVIAAVIVFGSTLAQGWITYGNFLGSDVFQPEPISSAGNGG